MRRVITKIKPVKNESSRIEEVGENVPEPELHEPSEAETDDEDESPPQEVHVLQRIWIRLSFVKYIFLILIIPPIVNYIALKYERVILIDFIGEQVDIGLGQKMFIRCVGKGSPTVILDAPTGGTSNYWYWVQKQIEESSPVTVCVYDRLGLGFSEWSYFVKKDKSDQYRKLLSHIASLEQMTNDLHHLVTVAKPLKRPFILVGSEIGALIARHYTMTYPEDVNDIILVNPFVEDLFWRHRDEWDSFWYLQMLPSLQSLQLAAYLGLSRIAALFHVLKPDLTGNHVPAEISFSQRSHMCNGHHLGGVLQEYTVLNTSFSQMSELWKAKTFPSNISVSVINSKNYDKFTRPRLMEAWQQSQLYLRQSLHPTCKHYVVEGTGLEAFTEPNANTIVNLIKQISLRWQVLHNDTPTVHTYREQTVHAE